MSLKALVIKEADLTEDLIEKVVSPYCRYTENGKIIPNQNFSKLSVKKKILVYLVAKSGLPFVLENDQVAISADNKELEFFTNIKGNTLRPRLSELREDGYVITESDLHKISNHAANYIINELKLK
jgi:hypothetical protein